MQYIDDIAITELFDRFDNYVKTQYSLLTPEEQAILDKYNHIRPNAGENLSEHDMNDKMCMYLISIAYSCTHIKAVEQVVFSSSKSSFSEFLNFAFYTFYIWASTNTNYRKLLELCRQEMKSISLSKLLSEDGDYSTSLSEGEFYDLLKDRSVKEKSLVIANVVAEKDVKKELKKAIVANDEDRFMSVMLSSEIDYSKAAVCLWSYNEVEKYNHLIIESNNKDLSKDQAYSYIVAQSSLLPSEVLTDMGEIIESYGKEAIPNIDWESCFSTVYKYTALMIISHINIYSICTNFEAIQNMNQFIFSVPEYNDLYNSLKSGELDVESYSVNIPVMDAFREKFMKTGELLPSQSNSKKTTKEYFESARKQDKDYCEALYQALSEEGWLQSDENTHYSFIYRFSNKYKGDKIPERLIWNGTVSDLYYFLYWFTDEAETRLPKKTNEFFILANGNEVPTNGAKHYADSKSTRIENLIKRL